MKTLKVFPTSDAFPWYDADGSGNKTGGTFYQKAYKLGDGFAVAGSDQCKGSTTASNPVAEDNQCEITCNTADGSPQPNTRVVGECKFYLAASID